ncbi:hypothetical protein STCU_06496 [Strigomonas culicis]|uniref:C-CAP/cofactor C-like domain-containing protein n=1 Tax=Strigomonas culicis TaxID=28005 RepID=S9U4N9_9TRYP|nr:hypothetical protein STCU_06496 [Strigomonas culicis]|eukprot:EPY25747.1 hypothetical protein STCU_06496 [Strigomonas culicis]
MSTLTKKKAEAEERRLKKESGGTAAAAAAASPNEAPVLMQEGDKRWIVRNQVGVPSKKLRLELDKVNMRQAVRIENCRFVYLQIKGKVNSITVVNCNKVQVALDSVVSSLDVLKCEGCDVQVDNSAPTVSIENSNSINLYLVNPAEARATKIVTACSSSVNVNFPSAADSEETVERAIPEQFVSRIVPDGARGYKIETKANETFS